MQAESSNKNNKLDTEFLKDIQALYEYKYENGGILRGKNFLNVFSNEYIYKHELKIFNIEFSQKYSVHNFDYVGFYKGNLKRISDVIISDLDKAVIGTNFLRVENAMNLKIAISSIKKCGVSVYDQAFYDKLNKFQLEDVTEVMFAYMRQAKIDGIRMAREFMKRIEKDPRFLLEYDIYSTFISDVKTGGRRDIKIRPPFDKYPQYIFDSRVIDYDDTGNILFGVYGKAIFSNMSEGGA